MLTGQASQTLTQQQAAAIYAIGQQVSATVQQATQQMKQLKEVVDAVFLLARATRAAIDGAPDDACDFSCDGERRLGAWLSGQGGFGTIAGDSSNGGSGSSYNLGGLMAGLDYAFDPRFTAGVMIGYSNSTVWSSAALSQSTSNTAQVGLYGRFQQNAFSVGGAVGYGHGQNLTTRQILLPSGTVVAQGSPASNQFFGFVETGYKVSLGAVTDAAVTDTYVTNAYVTPFTRLEGSTVTQSAYTESGNSPLAFNVAAQTANSLRTVLGTQVGWNIAKVDVRIEAGWSHEFADTSPPVTVSFVGAPAVGFTTSSAVTTPRDGAVLGLAVATKIAEATRLYARYDGELNGGTTSHIFSAGVRMTW
ncbi:autotransporter outer membrane beta-barrel domain-containing protein [Enhydrobacter aerosaccus]|nr:autotransporter outer membrane beta-barrel domain-containing protein [Enhydrobacter aerosaccus]